MGRPVAASHSRAVWSMLPRQNYLAIGAKSHVRNPGLRRHGSVEDLPRRLDPVVEEDGLQLCDDRPLDSVMVVAPLARPLAGVLTLTMVLIAFFILEGITAIVIAVQHRDHLRSWGRILFSGIIDLLLAYLIWAGWPSSAGWAIGLLVGINMIFFGLSLVMTALAARLMGPQST